MRALIIATLLFLVACLAPTTEPVTAQSSAIWFVALSGDDTADCLSEETACRTISGALGKAAADDSVRVAAGTYLENLSLTRNVTIVGAGADATVIDGGQRGTVATVLSAQVTAALQDLAIVRGQASGGGGGIANYGTMTLSGVLVAHNAVTAGEGFQGLGGGILNFGTLTISSSAVVENQGVTGAGIYSRGTFSASNLTVASNSAQANGGGLAFGQGSASVRFSTIATNSADGDAGGLFAEVGAAPALADSILAANSDGGDDAPQCRGTVNSSGFNILGRLDGCSFNAFGGDSFDADPQLGPLADNGGPTPTLALLEGSPAIDAAFAGRCPATDQRGVARPQGDGCDSGAFERDTVVAPPPSRTLYVAPDGDDAADCVSSATPCHTIGAAVGKAVSGDTVLLAAGTYSETVSLSKSLTIVGVGAPTTAIDGAGRGTVLTVLSSQARVALRDLTVRGGNAIGAGGGITSYGALSLERVSVQENRVSAGEGFQGLGGGIASFGTLTVSDTAVISNTGVTGGGIYSQGDLTASNVTFAGNTATAGGGLAAGAGTATLSYATVAGNQATGAAGGLQAAEGATIQLGASIVADNGGTSAAPECVGDLVSLDANLIGPAAGCTFSSTGPGDQIDVDPLLGPLESGGGPTLTRALLPESPAIDAGVSEQVACPAGDQRGVPRPQLTACDSGAYEAEPDTPGQNTLYVHVTGSDANDCLTAETPCATIGAALAKANPGNTIKIGGGRYHEHLALTRDVALEGAEAGDTVIDAEGSGTVVRVADGATAAFRNLTVTGGNADSGAGVVNYGHLLIEDSRVQENGLTSGQQIAQVRASLAQGEIIFALADGSLRRQGLSFGLFGRGLGAGIANFGSLEMTRTAVLSNTGLIGAGLSNAGELRLVDSEIAANSGFFGGGLANYGTAALVGGEMRGNVALIGGGAANFGDLLLTGTSVAGNVAIIGAGIANFGVLNVINCVLMSNRAHVDGGALINSPQATVSLRHVTVAGNSASGEDASGGLSNVGGLVSLVNTLLAANSGLGGAQADCGGPIQSEGHNLIETTSGCTLTAGPGDLLDIPAGLSLPQHGDPDLAALVPGPGSPAIDAGLPAACAADDQRGVARPQGQGCDIGAFESISIGADRTKTFLPSLAC
ncbi:MAG: hypothetical protein HGA45_34465 [Chloroflexales bacterium]|nr:hypothetical protein [Chloroflexales bacterium]